MDYTDIISNLIKPELLILIPVLYFIGVAIRKSEKIKNEYIPLVIGVIGVLISLIYVLATDPMGTVKEIMLAVFTAFTQGVLVAGASVYVNQLIKQHGNIKEVTDTENSTNNTEG